MRFPNQIPLAILCCLLTLGCFQPQESHVYFENIIDGESLTSTNNIGFGIRGYKVVSAGDVGRRMGHHHLLINCNSIAEGVVIPNENNHKHFGGGETQTELNFSPGSFVITLQFADRLHQGYGKR